MMFNQITTKVAEIKPGCLLQWHSGGNSYASLPLNGARIIELEKGSRKNQFPIGWL